ncbi:hypothetical protein Scep_028829 [Stephania cephalantha]|uniref:Large ribosomal subunit protein uL4m n=1 Tax=Stephania cephalantha TaxID=152367 RepID=A0AAP0EF94_9MAGN
MAGSLSRTVIRSFRSLSPLITSSPLNRSPPLTVTPNEGLIWSAFLTSRPFSSSVLAPQSIGSAIPPELLSGKKSVLTPDRTQDRYACANPNFVLMVDVGYHEDLVIPVTNFLSEDKGYMVLAGDVFDVPIRKDIVHRVVRWQLAKRQQGTHSTKTISEVSGTGRKPWKQKGTGRARHGTLRGPQLMIFDDLGLPSHKTKNIVNYVSQMENTKKVLLVDGGPIDEKLKLATQNVHYVNGLNVYSILLHDTLVMSRDAVNRIVERMHTPINR